MLISYLAILLAVFFWHDTIESEFLEYSMSVGNLRVNDAFSIPVSNPIDLSAQMDDSGLDR